MVVEQPGNEPGSQAQALADILAWSTTRPRWQRDALRRLCTTGELVERDLNELTDLCIGGGQGHDPLTAGHLPSVDADKATVNIRSVHGVADVNALSPGQRLSFDKRGMTVVFGRNGSGKSGYARILKRACRSRSPARGKEVLPNIYVQEPGTPRAKIEFAVGGQSVSTTWEDGETADPLLSAVSVFDSGTASVHVDGENEVAYTPLPLHVLAQLAGACREVKQRLGARIGQLKGQTPSFVSAAVHNGDTQVRSVLRTLGPGTEEVRVNELATLEEEERERLGELRADVNVADPAKAANALEERIRRLREANQVVGDMQEAVSGERTNELVRLYRLYQEAVRAAQVAAESAFSDAPLPAVGSAVWRRLWEAAREYSRQEAYQERDFPNAGPEARCVLCQGQLDEAAASRLRRFEEFVREEAKTQEDAAAREYESALQALVEADIGGREAKRVLGLVLAEADDAVHEQCRLAIGTTRWRLREVTRNHQGEGNAEAFAGFAPWPATEIEALIDGLSERVLRLRAEAGSAERVAATEELAELEDRVWLHGVKEDVIAEIERQRQRASLEAALGETTTNAITKKSREVARNLVTNTLRAEFAREVERLGVARLAVELRETKGSYGVPRFRVCLIRRPETRAGVVLSEGEHRCVALAAFLAELATSGSRSAIVFDDPVSSLDHNHRDAVAERLAEESLRRQVIVLTHDIAFLFRLDEACHRKRAHLAVRSVTRTEQYTGFVQKDPPAHARPVKKLIESMQKQLDKERTHYESGDHGEWEKTVDALQKRLRTGWERAVEEFIGPVFKRLSSKVETKGLGLLTVLEVSDCEEMRASYGRCSSPLHSMADTLHPAVPAPDEIQAELAVLREWTKRLAKRQSALGSTS